MTAGIVTNDSKDADRAYTREVCEFLQSRGVTTVQEPSEKADFWVVLGGDGTMLHAARRAAIYNIPMLGINLGNLGFLTDVDRHEGLTALEKVLQGKAKREQRLMLEIVPGNGNDDLHLPQAERLALNEVYLSRSGFGKLITLDVYINGQFMDSIRADGVMVATPTGSTAYNLASGGPILTPDGDMMVITAVCAHCLYTRPCVITARDEVRIVIHHETAVLLDGETRLTLEEGAGLTVRRSDYSAVILKTSDLHFYEILRRKMHH